MFKHAFSPSSFTIPSHASMFTSKYPSHHTIGFQQGSGKLDTDKDITLAEVLSGLGYANAAFVSSMVLRKETNLNAGFEEYDDEMKSNELNRPEELRRDGSETSLRAEGWIEENKDKDIFVFLHYFGGHGPYTPPEPYNNYFIDEGSFRPQNYILNVVPDAHAIGGIPNNQVLRPERDFEGKLISYEKNSEYYINQYDGGIRYTDHLIGQLLTKLKELDIYDDSLIIITSDHGEALGENNIFFFHGLSVTVDQILVPLIIKPHKGWDVDCGIIDTHITTLDLMPTILSLMDYDTVDINMASLDFEGNSLKKLIEFGNDPVLEERTLMSENEYQYALIRPNKLIEIEKKAEINSNYYMSVTELLDYLDGKKYYWDTGKEFHLRISFDQYQRYKLVSDIINKYRLNQDKVFRILEVGAGNEENLKNFLPADHIYLLDKEYPQNYENIGNYLSGDILKINLTETYDFVVSIDSYEHVPASSREIFIEKLLMPSNIATIIAAPFDTPGVRECEVFANESYKLRHGFEHKWLKEHIQNGLPSLQFTLELIDRFGYNCRSIPNGFLPRWFEMISLILTTERNPEFSKIVAEINEFYNTKFYEYDNQSPAYRQVLVVNKKGDAPDLSELCSRNVASSELSANWSMLQSMIQKVKESDSVFGAKRYCEASKEILIKEQIIKEFKNQFDRFERAIAERDGHISSITSQFQEMMAKAQAAEQAVSDQNDKMTALNVQLQNALSRICENEQALAERNEKIEYLNSEIQEKDLIVHKLEDTIAKKNSQIADISNQLHPTNIRAASLECEISEMRRSVLWRIAMGFHNSFVERTLPHGTKRRYNYDLGLKAARILANEGPSILLQEYKRRKEYNKAINYTKKDGEKCVEYKIIENEFLDQLRSFYLNNERPSEVKKKYYENSVDIVVCVHNAPDDVRACLESILKCSPHIYKLILVDDGSDEATKSFLQDFAFDYDAQLLRNELAKGYTRAANQGLRYSNGKYVVLLNSDVIVTPDWLDRMIQCAESDERIGIVGPLSNTASWQSIPKVNSNGDWATNELPECMSVEDMGLLIAKYSCRNYPKIPFLNGFCLLIKRELINEIGFFDERNFGEGYGEENDYCIRSRKALWELAVADDVFIYHAQSRSYSNERRKKLSDKAGKTLNNKHGAEEVCRGVLACKDNRVLAGIRARAERLCSRESLLQAGIDFFEGKRLLIILPVIDPGGGAYVIIQEAKSMIDMGVDVRLFNLEDHKAIFEENFPDLNVPVVYGQEKDIANIGRDYDSVMATVNFTVNWLEPLADDNKINLAYYIQDFEPHFYLQGSPEFSNAWESYYKIKNMINITKTNWNKEIIKKNIGVKCKTIGPSVDIDLFRPRERMERIDESIYIGAMIRPSTPRRNPQFTLEVLKDLKRKYNNKIKIITFGCSEEEFLSICENLDNIYYHIGVLKRSELPYLFNELDIFVDLSSYQAMGLTALEAMASGCTVVAPINGGCNEFIEDGKNGIVVDTTSYKNCFDAIDKIIINEALRKQLSSQSIFDACKFAPEIAGFNTLSAIFGDKSK